MKRVWALSVAVLSGSGGATLLFYTLFMATPAQADHLALQLTPELLGQYQVYLPRTIGGTTVAPTATLSLYVSTQDLNKAYNYGVAYGKVPTNGLIILAMGNVAVQNGQYGIDPFGTASFISTSVVASLTQKFIEGWWAGYQNLGGAARLPNAVITVAVGLNNCGRGGTSTTLDNPCVPGGSNMPPQHGQAWAQMVAVLRDWVAQRQYASKVKIAAAGDFEPGWNYASITRNWVLSYTTYFTSAALSLRFYDFGSCDGCSYIRDDGTICSACTTMYYVVSTLTGTVNWSWTLTDVRYMVWGAQYNYPVPIIYSSIHARQWYGVGRFSVDRYGYRIGFLGSLTTSRRFGFEPGEGWLALWDALYADPQTRISSLPWATDIEFDNNIFP